MATYSAKKAEYMAKEVYLAGVEKMRQDGTGNCFNWILSNII
jgi:hypothetical protein